MWAELREEIELELAMLQEHLDSFAELREAVGRREPDAVETMALGGMLHGFATENYLVVLPGTSSCLIA